MSATQDRPFSSASAKSLAGNGMVRPVLTATGVTKTYVLDEVEVHALRGVDLDVNAGEMLAIMGPSGSGKSTLMHVIGLLDLPTSGTVKVEGEEVSDMEPNKLAAVRNKRIGFVFQAFNLLARTTAQANVELPLIYAGMSASDRAKAAKEALDQVGLADRIHHLPNQLSGGQQQRVAIARALVTKPSIVLADEPTGNLDSRSGVEIMAILQRLNSEGITVVLVTHDHAVASHGQRIIHLGDGLIVRQETVLERIDAKANLEAMLAAQAASEAAGTPQ